MNTKLFEYFMIVASLGNLSRAAEQLFIPQPALSKYIASFEHELGVTLFRRTGKGVALTKEGEEVFSFCMSEQVRYNQLLDSIQKKRPKVVTVDIQNAIRIPNLMQYISVKCAPKYPEIVVRFQSDQYFTLCKRLIDGEVDLILTGNTVVQNIKDVDTGNIMTVPMSITYSDLLFEPQKERISIQDFDSKTLLLYEQDGMEQSFKYFILDICSKLRIHPEIFPVQNGDVMNSMITNGLGYAIESAVFNSLADNASIHFFPIDAEIDLCIARMKNNDAPEVLAIQKEIMTFCQGALA